MLHNDLQVDKSVRVYELIVCRSLLKDSGETPWTLGSCHPITKRRLEDLKEGFPMGLPP